MIFDPRRPAADPADTPLLAVLRDLEREGFTAQLASREGGTVHCYSCDTDHPAEAFHPSDLVRLEGASDPADMLAVVAAQCPNCGARGVLVATYGPEGTLADADVLQALDRAPTGREAGA